MEASSKGEVPAAETAGTRDYSAGMNSGVGHVNIR